MKKVLILLVVSVSGLIFNVKAQNYMIQVRPVNSDTWGYANLNGDIVIEPQFKKCYEFSEQGVAIVYFSKKNLYQLITLNGEVINIEQPDILIKDYLGYLPSTFNSGLVPVRKEKKWGYMNTSGQISIPLQYEYASDFNDGFAIVKEENEFLIITDNGNEIPIEVSNVKAVKEFSEGLAPFASSDGLWGFINTQGKVVVQAQYDGVGYFNAGLAWARTNEKTIGFINKNGEWIIKPQFVAAKNFDIESGLARVQIGDGWCYTDKAGNLVYPEDADRYDDFSEGLAFAELNEKIGFLNSKMEWVIQPQFEMVRNFKNGFAAVKMNGLWGIINKEGDWVIQPGFDSIKDVAIID